MDSLNAMGDQNRDDDDKAEDQQDRTLSDGNSDNDRNTSSKRNQSHIPEEQKMPGENKYVDNYSSMSDDDKQNDNDQNMNNQWNIIPRNSFTSKNVIKKPVKLEWGGFNTLHGSNTCDQFVQTDISIFGLNNELSLFAQSNYSNAPQQFESYPRRIEHFSGMHDRKVPINQSISMVA